MAAQRSTHNLCFRANIRGINSYLCLGKNCGIFYYFCSKHWSRVNVDQLIYVVVLRSTHNLWFRAKMRQIIYTHVHPQLARSITMVLRPSWLSLASSTISNIHLANQSQISCGASLGRGNKSLYKWFRFTWPRWPPCPFMLKTLKIFFSGTSGPDFSESITVCDLKVVTCWVFADN